MVGQGKRPLKVFLCHASGDKPTVRQLYKRLVQEGLDAWLDQEKLLPGQDWRLEIPKAVQEADVVVICLSNRSITKEGYIQKEIKFALDIADEKPEGTIFLIPARLEDCPVPERLNRWQWVDLFEENGYVRLLRSLKIRADKTGAVIEPQAYDDKEHEKRIEQLYTEGLAAFWVEDWDKACHRFQTILSEQPNHQGAIEKLEEAERQRNFTKLYSKAVEAQKNQEWQLAINTLEELLKKASTYKDAEAILKTARRELQLKTLYAEAKTLHTAQKWEAVLRVFEQISSIDPNYTDPEGLLASAQKEEAELQRLARLNKLYSNAIHKMDAGQWYEARTLLEQVHKSETGFLETERLLRKVEDEINRHEEQQKRQDQINTLYEQANGLLRSKKWRKALEKIEEIQTLDGQFDDPENIAEQAQKEIEREEQEAERQNELAAMYTEAVRFVREEKYQEALEKLQEVRNIDPKYPDRQMVQWTASRSLKALAKPVSEKRKVALPKSLWIGLGGVVIIAAVILALNLSGDRDGEQALPVIPVSSATQATNVNIDPTLYDNFENPPDGEYDEALWSPIWSGDYATVVKKDGQLFFTVKDTHQYRLVAEEYKDFFIREPFFMEAELFINPVTTGDFTHLIFSLNANHKITGDSYGTVCGIFSENEEQNISCHNFEKDSESVVALENTSPDWHTFRIEVYPPGIIRYVIDGIRESEYTFSQPDQFDNLRFNVNLGMNMEGTTATGYFDNVRMGTIADDPIIETVELPSSPSTKTDPTMYDDFTNAAHDGSYDMSLWSFWKSTGSGGKFVQNNGIFTIDVGVNDALDIVLTKYINYQVTEPIFYEARIMLESMMSATSFELNVGGDKEWLACSISNNKSSELQSLSCGGNYTSGYEEAVKFTNMDVSWHLFRIEIYPDTSQIVYSIDGIRRETYKLPSTEEQGRNRFIFGFSIGDDTSDNLSPKMYIDYVRIGAIQDDSSATSAPEQSICDSIQECRQLAEKAVESNDPESALDYFNLAINMVPSNLKPQYSGLWHDRADVQEKLQNFDKAQNDRDIWWLYDLDVQKIVFSSDRDGNNEIYVMDVKGEKVIRLTFDPSNDGGAAWSPDGSTIAFASDRSGNQDVFLMDLDGSNLRNLTNNPAIDAQPSWSPDGSQIAFYSDRSWNGDIYIMNADGTNSTCIVKDNASDWGPAWSPDGSKIAYSTDAYGDHAAVVMVNSDGSDFQDLSNHAAGDSSPSWSPDGKKITFTSKRRYDETMIYILDLESNKVELLLDAHGWGSKWSPDGNQIVFTSYNDLHDNEIALFDFQTQNLVFLTDNDANDERPSWSPLP